MKSFFTVASLLIITAISLSLTSCNKSDNCKNENLNILNPIGLQIKQGGTVLPDSVISKVKLYYYKGSLKSMLDVLYADSVVDDQLQGQGIIINPVQMIRASADEGITDFYLEYADSTIDNIKLEAVYVDGCQGEKEDCYCQYPVRKLTYNGVEGTKHPKHGYKGHQIYIVNR